MTYRATKFRLGSTEFGLAVRRAGQDEVKGETVTPLRERIGHAGAVLAGAARATGEALGWVVTIGMAIFIVGFILNPTHAVIAFDLVTKATLEVVRAVLRVL